ncbi:MAG TPA: tetratricopeptide repeat protein [Candidatus Sulfotelmatobacter sp.]|nr:tetratricopeptide repeat protein [Candidatus Sulfotelmatobacter sp.]
MIDPLLIMAQSRHKAGLLDDARTLYGQILARDPDHFEAMQLLGMVEVEDQNVDVGIELLERAARGDPDNSQAAYHLALGFEAAKRLDDAIAALERAVDLDPTNLAAARKVGWLKQHKQQYDEAMKYLERALELDPNDIDTRIAISVCCIATRRYGAAAAQCYAILEIDPDNVGVWRSLAYAQNADRDYEGARRSLERALELEPDNKLALVDLGSVLKALGLNDEAIAAYDASLALDPEQAVPWAGKGIVYHGMGRLEECIHCQERALEVDPTFSPALNNLGLVLLTLGRIEVAIKRFQKVVDEHGNPGIFSNLLFATHYLEGATPQALLRRHRRYDFYVHGKKRMKPPRHTNPPDPDRPLKVGYVSGDFAVHPVGFFVSSVITRHDKSRFESFCYSARAGEDYVGERIKRHADHFRRIADMTETVLTERIRDDGIDVLIDLSGHTAANRLVTFAHKPAPVQATWAGYVGTTGLRAMDWLIADRFHVPPHLEAFHSERVYRMPNGYICYEPFVMAPAVGPLPALRNGYVTFCSFPNPAKVNRGTIAVWARILAAVPDARLRLSYRSMNARLNVERIHGGFAKHGIDAARVMIDGGGDPKTMMDSYNASDIGLDTFPYSGGLTTCEALWMGVPVITYPGDRFESRHSFSHLSNAGLTETTARDLDDYVRLAVELANDLPRLADMRLNLRPRMAASPLCDPDRFVRDLESGFRTMWRAWCETQRRPSASRRPTTRTRRAAAG